MPLTLGKLGFGYENGIERSSASHKFEKISTEKLLQRLKSDNQNDGSEEGKFSIQHTSHLSLMNCFDLLQDLTNYSHELFSDLTYLVKATNQRINTLNTKLKTLQETPIETQIKQAKFTLVVPSENTSPNDENPPYQTFQSAAYHFTISLIDRNQLSLSLIRNLSKLQKNPNFEAFHSYPPEYFSKSTSQRVRLIGGMYSSPDYFLDQWLLQQERRIEEMETVKKEKKLDRKKRDKVKQKATQGNRRKSAGDGIQIVRWQDRYSGDGRTIASGRSKSSKATHSYFGNRPASNKSLNFDDVEDDNSTIATTTSAKPFPDDESTTTLKKKPSQEIDGQATKERSLSIASTIMSEEDIPPRPSVAGLFPKVDDSKPLSKPSKDEDDDDDEEEDDEMESKLNLSALSNESDGTASIRAEGKGSIDEAESAPKPRPKSVRIILREDQVIPKLEVLCKNVVVDLEDPSVFISPIPFLVMDDESLSSRPTSKRMSVELRYSNVYEERVVSSNVNPEKVGTGTPIAERNKEPASDKVKLTPSPPPGAARPPRPPPPPKRESLGGNSPGGMPNPPEPPKERKVGFANVPPPPPKVSTQDLPPSNDEDQSHSPLGRSDRRILTKSVRLGQNFADILAAAPKAKPPPPPPPPAAKFSKPEEIPSPPPAPTAPNTSESTSKNQSPPPPPSAPVRPPPPPAAALHRPPPPPVQVAEDSPSPSVSSTSSPLSPPPLPRPSFLAGMTPSPTNSEGGNKPMGLLDAIRRGSTLKKVTEEETVATKKATATSGTSLGAFGSSAVTAILERRKFVVESDSESDSDKEAWD